MLQIVEKCVLILIQEPLNGVFHLTIEVFSEFVFSAAQRLYLSSIMLHCERVYLLLLPFLWLDEVLVVAALSLDLGQERHICSFREYALFIQQLQNASSLYARRLVGSKGEEPIMISVRLSDQISLCQQLKPNLWFGLQEDNAEIYHHLQNL